ncbi:nucleotidyltransferase family protein [Alteromonas lipolytica]|uniref:Nitrate reductase n=1 Tax=Alteromonas lipolytica TaxID=1856405 RepID=A0A1E8FFF4_9ALTE|nr:nucleotidyltransferase family protein [Alteromonas lipolytica]OFI34662.1 nitrate reductase [Alteromonas lipolytica]GGF52997.1 hypothetical protein GCM10011338_01380 [Alteromonas lipolytica]
MASIESLLAGDEYRMDLLQTVASLALPDWYIAAGFVRNMVWDHLHGFSTTPLTDIDVLFFDNTATYEAREIEKQLVALRPRVPWQVKNQALMHQRNQDPPYRDCADAMRYWPEQETAVGVRLDVDNGIVVAAPFGVASLWAGQLTPNPKRDFTIFARRVATKDWLTRWPNLSVAGI